MNDAFAEILGYPPEGLPYRWPHPWLVDKTTAAQHQSRVRAEGSAQYETPVRHQSGHLAWAAVSINAVRGQSGEHDVYVGTIRDITAERAFAARESAVHAPGDGCGGGQERGRGAGDHPRRVPHGGRRARVVAVMWPTGRWRTDRPRWRVDPRNFWRAMDPLLRHTFQDARHQLPLTARTIEWPDTGQGQGLVAVLSGTADVALWLELRVPRWVIAEDRLLVTVLSATQPGHPARPPVRERAGNVADLAARHAATVEPPPGFAVRYEPAVPPLESAATGTTCCHR